MRDTPPATSTPPRTRAHPSILAAQRSPVATTPRGKGKQAVPLESSASSNSSAAPPSSGNTPSEAAAAHQRISALSPRHRAELARLNPRRSGTQGEGSDGGTPSMGSSFSDLDGESRGVCCNLVYHPEIADTRRAQTQVSHNQRSKKPWQVISGMVERVA